MSGSFLSLDRFCKLLILMRWKNVATNGGYPMPIDFLAFTPCPPSPAFLVIPKHGSVEGVRPYFLALGARPSCGHRMALLTDAP